jgi:hypothetical protein
MVKCDQVELLFGRFAAATRMRSGQKPETFEFLGFKHVCGTDRGGRFTAVRIPSVRSCRRFLARVREWQWRRTLCRQGRRRKLNWRYLETRDWVKLPLPSNRAVHPTV